MIWQNIKNAFISIRSAKLRSFLTMLGVIIGVFAVMVMIGIGDGVKAEVGGQINSLGTNVLTIVSGQMGQNSSTAKNGQQQKGGGVNFGNSFGSSTLTTKDAQTASDTNNVEKTATIMPISSALSYNDLTSNTAFVIGANPNYFGIRNIQIESGSAYNDADNVAKKNVIVIGADTKQNLFGDADAIGKEITIRGQKFTVIGVQKKSDTGVSFGASSDDIVYMPYSTAAQLTGTDTVFRILVQVNDAKNIDGVKASLENSIKANHGGSTDFSVLTQDELVGTFNSILDILTTFVIAIASISLIVGGIGIMNIMLVTVSERTREIGIRKAMGATFGNIMGQFLIEAIIISLLGGLLGLLFAYLAGLLIKKFAGITPVYSAKALLLAVGVSLFVGVVFGTAPAIKAARKRPIQALKAL